MAKAGSQLATASLYMYEPCQRKKAYTDAEKALDASKKKRSTLRRGRGPSRAMDSVTNRKRFTASLV